MIRNRYLTSSHASRNRQDIWEIDRSCAILSRHPFFPKTTLPTVNFPPESFEANGRSNLRRKNPASRFPTEAGHGRVGRIAGQGGSGWCGSKGGKGQTLSSTCCNLSTETRTNTCQTNFCRGDKNFCGKKCRTLSLL